MKPVLFLLVTLLLAQASISSALAQDDPPELKSFRIEFQAKLAKLNQTLKDLDEKYQGYLEKQKSSYQQKGMLKAMLAVDEELKHFEDPPSEKAAISLSTFPELKRLQQIYREQRETQKAAIAAPRLT